MSHCNGENVSVSVAGALGRSPGGGPCASPPGSSFSLTPKLAVDDAPSTALSCVILLLNESESDRAIATPISGHVCTTVPPAFWTADDTSAGTACCLYSTT